MILPDAWLQKFRDALIRVGAWPQRAVVVLVTAAVCAWIAINLLWLHQGPGISHTSYDSMVRQRVWAPPPDPRILIVDIDEASLAAMAPQFGRWPWSRDTLATVAEWLERRGAAAIVWDVVFSDADHASPGGDSAFDAAAANSPHSHFAVVRLPAEADAQSQVGAAQLPRLWALPGPPGEKVALIPPAFASIAASRLGFNNATPDADGVIRRYRWFERLPGGGVIQSLPLSVLASMEPQAYERMLARIRAGAPEQGLISWPLDNARYQRVSFHTLFEQAENGTPGGVPLAGRVVIVGSTAPSLHDVHPTPLSATAPGVETLAAAVDDALHERWVGELTPALRASLAIVVCVLLAWWARRQKAVGALKPLLLVLPSALLALSFASLHSGHVFVDVEAPAAYALLLMAAFRTWDRLRRSYWTDWSDVPGHDVALWAWHRARPWDSIAMDRVMDVLQRSAPHCRLVLHNDPPSWPAQAAWPELSHFIALVGPASEFEHARAELQACMTAFGGTANEPVPLPRGVSRKAVLRACFDQWAGTGQPSLEAAAL